jgi:ADP-heptose:LPS heptosyltransferase
MAIEAVYSTNFSFLECLIGWTGAPRRIAFECTYAEKKRDKKNPFFTELVPEQKGIIFEMERNFHLLGYLGATHSSSEHAEIWLREGDIDLAKQIQKKMNDGPYAILFPGAAKQARMWSAEKYFEVITEINGAFPMKWIICGGHSENDLCERLAERLRDFSIPAKNLAGKTTLRELYGLIKGAVFYLGSESMAAHLAAAACIPSVTILGGAYYGRFYPYPNNALTVAATNKLPCWGCNWVCRYDEAECITSIPVEDVVRAAVKLLGANVERK